MSRKKEKVISYAPQMYKEGANLALYCVARQFGVDSRKLRLRDSSVWDKAALLAELIRRKMKEEVAP